MRALVPFCLVVLAVSGCSIPGLQAPQPTPTVAACIPVVLQDRQNQHQLSGGIAAIDASPVTVLPPPVMTQPPPMTVTPTPSGPVIMPAPTTPPTLTPPTPSGGPIVTPSAKFKRRLSDIENMGELVAE